MPTPPVHEEFEWQIINKFSETPDTYTYSFIPTSKSQQIKFNVGQSVTITALLKRPTASGKLEENLVERTYSIASSPTRDKIDLTIKDEKPYGYINPSTGKADGFAAYFFDQYGMGHKLKVRLNSTKNHFLSKIAAGIEKDIAYWSGANGAEPVRSLIQLMEDNKQGHEFSLTLFYSNPFLYADEARKNFNVIYYKWLIDIAKKMPNFRVIFTFTRDKESYVSDHDRVTFRRGRFFIGPNGQEERTLSIFHGNSESAYNPVCGSSGFISGVVKLPDGRIERRKGIIQDLMNIVCVKPEKIDKEQYYLQVVGAE
jgi:ferredoxin-NADP reductase